MKTPTPPAPAISKGWRNRMVGEGTEAPDQLLANPRNWRIHPHEQEQALVAVLDKVGWVTRVIVNKRTGFVIDGHLRVASAISRGEASVPVTYVDLTEAEEMQILATFDATTGMAVMDAEKYRDLVAEAGIDSADMLLAVEHAADLAGADIAPPDADDVGDVKPAQLSQAIQLQPAREYVVVMCSDDPEEFERLKVLLDLRPVRRGGYKVGSPFDDAGTQRVIHASDLIKRLENANSDSK